MRYVKMTVLKTDYNEELAKEYGVEGLPKCPIVKEGQEIICKRHLQPEEICDEAWKCMQHHVYALYYGATIPFGHEWMKDSGVAIVTCNDGLRPVTFKLELIERD